MGFFRAFSVELPRTSNGETVSGAGGLKSPEFESVTGASTTAAALFNKNAINAIAGFIKNVDSAHNSHLVNTNRRMLAVVMVTSTFTPADNTLSDGTVGSTTTTTISSSFLLNPNIQVVSNKYHCLLRTPISTTMASCNCNSFIVNNSQAVTLFSVV